MARQTLLAFRRDTAANWTATNPTLAAGEPGFESNTGKFKIGDGATAWNALAYIGGGTGTISSITSSGGTLTVTNPAGPATNLDMPATGVAAATYGDSTHVARLTVDAEGRLTAASSVAISGSSGAGGLITLYDSGYLGGSQASIDTGAGGIAAGHFCLVALLYGRTDDAGQNQSNVNATFNNDAAGAYSLVRLRAIGPSATAPAVAVTAGATSVQLGVIPSASAAANLFGNAEFMIPAYDGTANYKSGNGTSGSVPAVAGGNQIQDRYAFTYASTAAISRLKIVSANGGNFVAGTRLVIYGTQ